MQSKNTEYLARLDHLRFLAAAAVLLFHTYGSTRKMPERPADYLHIPIIDQGHTGVMLFMVISGFILGTIANDKEIDIWRFYINRILRIYPLYVFVIAYGYYSVLDQNRATQAGIDFIFALLPISNLYSNYGAYGGQFWSIAVELQFYLLFPFILAFKRSFGRTYIYGLIGLMMALRTAQFAIHGSVHAMAFATIFGNLDLFLIGALTADLNARQTRSDRQWWHAKWIVPASFVAINLLLYLIFGRFGFFHVDTWGISKDGTSRSWIWIVWPTVQGLIWSGFLLAYLRSELFIPLSGVLAWLGRRSYSMYAWHLFVLYIFPDWLPSWSPYAYGMFFILPVTIAVSAVSYKMIEEPFLKMRVRYIKSDPVKTAYHRHEALPATARQPDRSPQR